MHQLLQANVVRASSANKWIRYQNQSNTYNKDSKIYHATGAKRERQSMRQTIPTQAQENGTAQEAGPATP
jgi:hypothetical protein